MTYKVTKRLQSAAVAHRLGKGYPGKCLNLHGHNYFFEVEVETEYLDKYDMAIDFGDIKKICDKFVQDNWDHATLVSQTDTNLLEFLQKEKSRHFVTPANINTTAEWMSEFLSSQFGKDLTNAGFTKLKSVTVRVWETEDSYSTATFLLSC